LGVELKNGKLELVEEVGGAPASGAAPVTPAKPINGTKANKGSKRKAKDTNGSPEDDEAQTPGSNKKVKADAETKDETQGEAKDQPEE
jgi:hypothetical protein